MMGQQGSPMILFPVTRLVMLSLLFSLDICNGQPTPTLPTLAPAPSAPEPFPTFPTFPPFAPAPFPTFPPFAPAPFPTFPPFAPAPFPTFPPFAPAPFPTFPPFAPAPAPTLPPSPTTLAPATSPTFPPFAPAPFPTFPPFAPAPFPTFPPFAPAPFPTFPPFAPAPFPTLPPSPTTFAPVPFPTFPPFAPAPFPTFPPFAPAPFPTFPPFAPAPFPTPPPFPTLAPAPFAPFPTLAPAPFGPTSFPPTIPTPPQPPLPPASCEDCPDGWYDIDGDTYNCEWYGTNNFCSQALYYPNFGYSALQACCSCGGGRELGTCDIGSPTDPPTTTPSSLPTDAPCEPFVADWFDSDGSDFTCEWYGLNGGACEAYGNDYANFGYTANENCCECGGGNKDFEPTVSPAPTGQCQDCVGWYDSAGSIYDCAWYSLNDFCDFAYEYVNFGFSAVEACCVCGGTATSFCDIGGGGPTVSNPTYGAPTYGAPTYGSPTYGSPTYGAPTYGFPTYGAPTYGFPTYGAPTYGFPTYGAPTYGFPTYGFPSISAPTSVGPPVDPNCEDDPVGWYDIDGPYYDCVWYGVNNYCSQSQFFPNFGTTAEEACCVCGGGVQKSAITLKTLVLNPTVVEDSNLELDDGSWVVTDGSPEWECGELDTLFGECYYHFFGGSGDQRIEQVITDVGGGVADEVFELIFYAMGVDLPGKKYFKGYIKTKSGSSKHAYPCRSTRDGSFDFRMMKCTFVVEEDFDELAIVFKYMGESGDLYLDSVRLDRSNLFE